MFCFQHQLYCTISTILILPIFLSHLINHLIKQMKHSPTHRYGLSNSQYHIQNLFPKFLPLIPPIATTFSFRLNICSYLLPQCPVLHLSCLFLEFSYASGLPIASLIFSVQLFLAIMRYLSHPNIEGFLLLSLTLLLTPFSPA